MSTISQDLPSAVHSKEQGESCRQGAGQPSYLPGALAAVASVWFATEFAARFWGHVGGGEPVGFEPFVVLAVAAGSAAVALRNHLRTR
ncbi:MAG TPA: hypothetical protein VKA64_07105 [Gammaproteobacteria bacterium]|nr:hypothetical protein [Gammaproteobacteria bacterium]